MPVIKSYMDKGVAYPKPVIKNIMNFISEKTHTEDCKNINEYTAKLASILDNFADKYSVKDLSAAEAKTLRDLLIVENTNLIDEHLLSDSIKSPFLPKNPEEYCELLNSLSMQSMQDSPKISEELQKKYYIAMKTLETGTFIKTDLNNGFKLELSYPREKFIKDFQLKTNNLPKNEQIKVASYYGLGFTTRADGTLQTDGYPTDYGHSTKEYEPDTQCAIENLRKNVNEFSYNNKIHVKNNPEIETALNDITKAFPEFLMTVNKPQHKVHSHTVDIHTLNVLQNVMLNPQYKKLSESDKQILQLSVLLHDITKAENMIDKTHPAQSAFDAFHIIAKMDLTENERTKVYEIIKNHDWLEKCNLQNSTDAQKHDARISVAFDLRKGNTFDMSAMLTNADLKSVKSDGTFFDKFCTQLDFAQKDIKDIIKQIKATAIYLPQSKLPKASELIVDNNFVSEVTIDNITNKIVRLEPHMNFTKYGFAKGTNYKNLSFFAHAFDGSDVNFDIFKTISNFDSSSAMSASYVNLGSGNMNLFDYRGFVLEVEPDSIYVAYDDDIRSGFKKDIKSIKENYIQNSSNSNFRNYVSTLYKSKLNMNDDNYIDWYEDIKNKSSVDVANSEYDYVIDYVQENLSKNAFNEVIISHPKIKGLFVDGGYPEELSKSARKYAQDNDLPIFLLNSY